jgi:hypothetical protein
MSKLLTHQRYLSKHPQNVDPADIAIGDILSFEYAKEGTPSKTRWVFVLHPEYDYKMHLLDITIVDHLTLLQIASKLNDSLSPHQFYRTVICSSFVAYQEAYRTYKSEKIVDMKRYDYRQLFSLAPISKADVFQYKESIAVSYDKKINLTSNHPLISRIQELADKHGTYTVEKKPKKMIKDFIERYNLNATHQHNTWLDSNAIGRPTIFQLFDKIESGGVYFVDPDSIPLLYGNFSSI